MERFQYSQSFSSLKSSRNKGMSILPAKKLLAATVLLVLKGSTQPLKASAINDAVAEILQIPESVLQIEDANCIGTEYSYQMRWVRTDLKNKRWIINPPRGYWALAKCCPKTFCTQPA